MELNVTERAQEVVRSYVEQSGGELRALRITARQDGPEGARFELSLVSEADKAEDDISVDMDDFSVFVSEDTAKRLEGATVDFVERVNESGFEIRPPERKLKVAGPPKGELAEKIKDVLDAQVNPAVAAHGGEIVLVDVQGTEIFIEMGGGCQGCALSRMTLKQGVERMVRQAVPEITAVHDVTDHGSGDNPFY
ncbi:MAG: NifU family protein [Gemmatimonadota bacterium]